MYFFIFLTTIVHFFVATSFLNHRSPLFQQKLSFIPSKSFQKRLCCLKQSLFYEHIKRQKHLPFFLLFHFSAVPGQTSQCRTAYKQRQLPYYITAVTQRFFLFKILRFYIVYGNFNSPGFSVLRMYGLIAALPSRRNSLRKSANRQNRPKKRALETAQTVTGTRQKEIL